LHSSPLARERRIHRFKGSGRRHKGESKHQLTFHHTKTSISNECIDVHGCRANCRLLRAYELVTFDHASKIGPFSLWLINLDDSNNYRYEHRNDDFWSHSRLLRTKTCIRHLLDSFCAFGLQYQSSL